MGRLDSSGSRVVEFCALAIVCASATQCLSTRQSELPSEILCWALMPALFAGWRGRNRDPEAGAVLASTGPDEPASSLSLWLSAISILTVALYKAETGPLVCFLPILSVLLQWSNERLGLQAAANKDTSRVSVLVNAIRVTGPVALFVTLSLANWDVRGCFLSAFAVGGLWLLYTALEAKTTTSSPLLPAITLRNDASALSWRVITLLVATIGLRCAVIGLPHFPVLNTVAIGTLKSGFWFSTAQVASHTTWRVATLIDTFGQISTQSPFIQSSGLVVLSHILASLLSLTQITYTLPPSKSRPVLWAFVAVSLVPYATNFIAIQVAHSSAVSAFKYSRDHPVERLVDYGQWQFNKMLERQSADFDAAEAEYRKRYNFDPPPGFRAWFDYAKSQDSAIIDDFDTIYDSVSPFWAYSGSEVVAMMNQAYTTKSNIDLWQCELDGESATTVCSHPRRTFDRHYSLLFDTLLKNVSGTIPSIRFLANHLDEPRVVLPSPATTVTEVEVVDMSHKSTWTAITKSCSSVSSSPEVEPGILPETYSLPFITNISSAMNLCEHPEYGELHGFFMSPSSCKLINSPVPVLSVGAPSTMGDILFPSPAYIEEDFLYNKDRDVEWVAKRNNVYWAGSTTGGYAADDRWRRYHRQRFVALAHNLDQQRYSYLREKIGTVNVAKTSFVNSRLFDATLTRINQCDAEYCKDQVEFFKMKGWSDDALAYKSRLNFDTDGNGISGRYYRMLASNSVPLKQTIFREWHDDRLVPWVHYVPVSQGMSELPELISHLLLSDSGEKSAEDIARQGQEWHAKALRQEDMGIYAYRLLLELARLQDPKRKAR